MRNPYKCWDEDRSIIKIDASASTISSDPSQKPLLITIPIPPPSLKKRIDWTGRRRLERTPVIIFSVVVLLLDPSSSPAFAPDAVSNRTIYANFFVFVAEAKSR